MTTAIKFDSIESWATAHGITLDDALDAGVSQHDETEAIQIPRDVWNDLRRSHKFLPGDRVFSHYVMDWGTVTAIDNSYGDQSPDQWYRVEMDKGTVEQMNDGGNNVDLARIVSPALAERFGYGIDPKAA